ncbi:MAG: DUF983 domain-containing protein [Williamsia sp.]|nr:DUF983 domain-containing protein [Williamsia sp.]
MDSEERNPGYLMAVLTNKCPRCRQGHLYKERNPYKLKSVVTMNEACPVCGQPTDIEVGFYYGTSYVSYALAIVVCVASFIAWWVLIGFSFKDSRFFWWMGFNAVLLIVMQPLLMRLSRTLWLSWFVKYDPNWKENKIKSEHLERIVSGQMNNW